MFKMASKFSICPDIQWKLIEGRAVLLDINGASIFKLDRVATAIWTMACSGHTGGQIVTHLVDDFDVEKKAAQRDVARILKRLVRDGLIAQAR